MARDGELAEPRVPAPTGMRTVLTFTRLSKPALAIVRRAVDEDDDFRARVAEAADEATVGRAGWLWLRRPEGWEDDLAVAAEQAPPTDGAGSARLRRERDGAEAAAARHRRAAEEADAARRRAEQLLVEAREQAARAVAAEAALRDRLAELEDGRNRAVRAHKAVEADLAAARRDLKAARAAARQAEAELLAARAERAGPGPTPPPAPRAPAPDPTPAPAPAREVVEAPPAMSGEAFDRAAVQDAVAAASRAAAALAAELARASAALAPVAAVPADPGPVADQPAARGGTGRRGRRPPVRRARPALPPGVLDGSAEAHRHLVTTGAALLVVDGYNLARTTWADLAPEEERRRTVALLEEVAARSGGPVTVVFDGDDHAVAPAASRHVRVRFSASGQTADEAIADLLRDLPATQAALVVSSDRAVADDARAQGAVALGAAAFLAAAGR